MDAQVAAQEAVVSAGVIVRREVSAAVVSEVATVEVAVRSAIARPTTGPTCARSSGTAPT